MVVPNNSICTRGLKIEPERVFSDGDHNASEWVGDGATHINFAGNGPGADPIQPHVTKTITAFLAGVRAHSCALIEQIQEMILRVK
jgi:hypothetical protein